MRDATTVYLPQSLRQQPVGSHAASGVLGTLTYYAAPISNQLETILLASSLDAQTAKGNFVVKAGRPQPKLDMPSGKKIQGATMSRQQANGTSLTSVSSTKPQIQRKRCHLARRHYLSACHSLCANNLLAAMLPAVCLCLTQFVTMHWTMHQPPSAINLKPYSWRRHCMLRRPKGTFVIKAERPQPNSTFHR